MPRKKTPARAASDVARLKSVTARMLDALERALAGEKNDEDYARLFGTKPPLAALDTLAALLLKLQENEKDTAALTGEPASLPLSEADEALVRDFLNRAREYAEEEGGKVIRE